MVVLFLFRPYQIKGIRKKLISASCCGFLLDALYRVSLQALGISHSKLSTIQKLPLYFLSFLSFSWQIHLVTNHFLSRQSTRQRITFFFQVAVVLVSIVILAIPVAEIIYLTFNKQTMNGKLLIALFAPLNGVALTVTSRICFSAASPGLHSSGIFICLTGAVVRFFGDHVSCFTSGSRQFTIHRDSRDNSRVCGSNRKKRNGLYWSYLPLDLEKNSRSLGKFSHSSWWEANGWYYYYEHAVWINCYSFRQRLFVFV